MQTVSMRTGRAVLVAGVSLLTAALFLPGQASASAARTERVSVSTTGKQGDESSFTLSNSSVSADGRFVAFLSTATNLVAGDTNGNQDVFVRDRRLHKTVLASVSTTGKQGDRDSVIPSVSADGRFVAFESSATNLVAGDANGAEDVFVRDLTLNKTYRVSISAAGVEGDGESLHPSISADGRFVAFESSATNLVVGDANGAEDVFIRDRKLNRTYRVSFNSAGVQGNGSSLDPSISSDGRFVAFNSNATNLVAGDTNGTYDVFVRDRKLHKTVRVSMSTTGKQGDGTSSHPSISADGRFVAFNSNATNLVAGDTNGAYDVFERDRTLHKTYRMSVSTRGGQGDGNSGGEAISADGRFVAFSSYATNLVGGDTNGTFDVFVRDRTFQKTYRVSISASGFQANGASDDPSISADGHFVAFESSATNLVARDTNGLEDVFVRGPLG